MSGSKQPIEIIELSDDSDDGQETPLVKHLRKELAASRKATKIAQEDKAKLQKELADAKRDLQTVNSTAAQADTSHEEIARILNQELTDVTAALNEAHQVNARLKETFMALWKSCECAVCFEPIWSPMVYLCGHIICQNCSRVATCAHCRAPTRGVAIKLFAFHDIVRTLAPLAAPGEASPQRSR